MNNALPVSCAIMIGAVIILIFSHKIQDQEVRLQSRVWAAVLLGSGIFGLIITFTRHLSGS